MIPRRGATHAFREPNATIIAVSTRRVRRKRRLAPGLGRVGVSEHSFVCLDTDRAEECIIGACLDWEDIWNAVRSYIA